jgi:hypothetical protein
VIHGRAPAAADGGPVMVDAFVFSDPRTRSESPSSAAGAVRPSANAGRAAR